ncbi:MAG TPA: hypothetical protein VM070_00275 [Candidatus Saccharimonadales bacterium]|nr:hypothetical protein [Candidatus Saccharimonadales bacterium]
MLAAIIAVAGLPFAPVWQRRRPEPSARPAWIAHPDGAALADAGWRWTRGRWELVRLGSLATAMALLAAAGGPILLGAVGLLGPSLAVRMLAQAARDRARGPATRLLVAAHAALRSGVPLAEALRQGLLGCDDRIARRPVEAALRAFDLGEPLDRALIVAARALPSGPAATAFEALALGIGERLPLERVAALLGAVTDRALFEERLAAEVAAHAAGARMQLWLLAAIVPALALYLALSMPALAATLGGPLGRTVLVPGAFLLEIGGVLLSRRIVRQAGC